MSKQRSKVLLTCLSNSKYPGRCAELEQFCASERRSIYRFELKRIALASPFESPHCPDSFCAASIARGQLWGLDREHILAIYLNARNYVTGVEIVAIGVESSCPVAMTTLFRGALIAGARGIIVAHNHPSGDVTPSAEDVQFLRQVRETGRLLDCPLVDFLIVTDSSVYSDSDSIDAGKRNA